jgi:hypothetical protein
MACPKISCGKLFSRSSPSFFLPMARIYIPAAPYNFSRPPNQRLQRWGGGQKRDVVGGGTILTHCHFELELFEFFGSLGLGFPTQLRVSSERGTEDQCWGLLPSRPSTIIHGSAGSGQAIGDMGRTCLNLLMFFMAMAAAADSLLLPCHNLLGGSRALSLSLCAAVRTLAEAISICGEHRSESAAVVSRARDPQTLIPLNGAHEETALSGPPFASVSLFLILIFIVVWGLPRAWRVGVLAADRLSSPVVS